MSPHQTPRSVTFRREREAQWNELDGLLERALRGGLTALSGAELRRLPVLYRQTLAALSVARSTALDESLVAYLEALAARAYLAMYGSRRSARGELRKALFHRFPQQVRALGREVALALAVTVLGVVVAMLLMKQDMGWYDAFVAPELAGGRDPQASTESLRDALYGGGDGSLGVFASYLFTHNSQVGLTAFALGFAAGVPTVLLLFSNGLMLGAFLSLYASRGMLVPLLGWLLPHGIPEIGAIVLCGAAGMHLGRAMLWPGERSTTASLMAAGRRSSLVIFGCIALFAIAGVLEGVFRQVITNDAVRFSLAAINAIWFFGWLVLGGRESSEGEPPSVPQSHESTRGTIQLVGPEGVPLRFEPALIAERAFAFCIDAALIAMALVLVALFTFYVVALLGVIEPLILTLIAIFVLRYGHFIFWELRWQGATPGKRLLNLKVVSRNGSALSTESIIARNLMRDVELFIPLVALAQPTSLVGDLPWWLSLAAILWLALMLFLPFYARERTRVGDLVGGTIVVRVPRAELSADEAARSHGIRFSDGQLAVYGEEELETLRRLLADHDAGKASEADLRTVAQAIATRIEYAGPHSGALAFLRSFYAAQRAILEKKLLFGKRKRSKRG